MKQTLLLLTLLIAFTVHSQTTRLSATQRIIHPNFADTTAANAGNAKEAYNVIALLTNQLALRNSTNTKWSIISGLNIYNSDGTLGGNRIVAGAGNTLNWTGLSAFNINDVDALINTVTAGKGSGTTTFDNTAFGRLALKFNTTGKYNTAFGSNTLKGNTIGEHNTALGRLALQANINGNNNTGIGSDALLSNQTGNNNTAVGYGALSNNTTGANNTSVGMQALPFNTTGSLNSSLGYNSLARNRSGLENTAIGANSLAFNDFGSDNTAVGVNALSNNSLGSNNVAVGTGALLLYEGGNNVAIGTNSLRNATTGNNNIAIGHQSALGLTSGNNNIMVTLGGTGVTTGQYNTLLGNFLSSPLSSATSNQVEIRDGIGSFAFKRNNLNNVFIPVQPLQYDTTKKIIVQDGVSGQLYRSYWPTSGMGLGTVTSVGLVAPPAFVVSGSPVVGAGNLTLTGAGLTTDYIRGDGSLAPFPAAGAGSVTSVGLAVPSGLTVTGSPVATAGTLTIGTTLNGVVKGNGAGFTAGNVNLASEVTGTLPIANGGTNASTANDALNNLLPSQTGNNGKVLVTDGSNTVWTATSAGTVTSVALTTPAAFSVTGSPITTNGTLAINALGTTAQYIRGDGTLATLPTGGTGTVTSVGLTVPTGLSVTGSPVIGSGTIGITTALNGVVKGNGSGFTTSNVDLTSEVTNTLPVSNGGIGNNTLTPYAPLFGGTTSTSPTQSGTVGLTGQVLTSNGAGTLPTFQNLSCTCPTLYSSDGILATNRTVSGASHSNLTFDFITGFYVNNINATINGLTVGSGRGLIPENTVFGKNALSSNTSGTFNSLIGFESGKTNTTGIFNTALGYKTLNENITGTNNTVVGGNAGQIVKSSSNTLIGYNAGVGLTIGGGNNLIGTISGFDLVSGSNNSFFGAVSGIITGSGNTVIGNVTLPATTTNNVVITDGTGNLAFQKDDLGNSRISVQALQVANVSSAALLNLNTNYSDYVFNGTTGTWILPSVSTSSNVKYFIKNRGSGNLTITTFAGGNEIYTTLGVSSVVLAPGSSLILSSDTFFWNKYN